MNSESVEKIRLIPRNIFGNNQITNMMKRIKKTTNTDGYVSADHIPIITKKSSLIEVNQLLTGSGEELIMTRPPAFVA